MTELWMQSMRRTLTTLSSGVGSLTTSVGSVVQGVGTLSAAVSTTMLNLATEDHDLAEFEEPDFASDLKGRLDKELSSNKRAKRKHRDKEVSVDSGVATDPLQDGQVGSDQDDSNRSNLRKGVSSNSSSLSLSSVEEEFMQGLNFTNHHAELGSSDVTAVVAREDEFLNGLSFQDLNVVHVDLDQGGKDEITEITDNEDILTSSDHQVSDDDDVMMTSSDDDDEEFSLGTVDITATEVFLARKRNESAESRTLAPSLSNSGNLSDLRRSTNDLSLTPRPISNTQRSKSTLTLSPLNTSEESTYRKHSSFDTVKSRSEAVLNTILEREDQGMDQRSIRYNNFVEMSHHDPTTIESFDSSSGEDLDGSDYQGSESDYDADEDLIEKKDPFRESFIGGSMGLFAPKREENQFSPTSCVKRKTLQNFNVGPGPSTDVEATENSVIETISEISNKSQKSCNIARKSQVKLKPLPMINAQIKSNNCAAVDHRLSKNLGGNLSKLPQQKYTDSPPHTFESPPSAKRKNHLKPPSQTGSVQKEVKFKDSPRSLTQRSNSCTNLNSRTEEVMTRSGTLDGFNSLDKTRSYADITYTPGNFTTESSPTADLAEKSVTAQNSSLMVSHVVETSEFGSVGSGEESYRGRSGTETSSSSTFYSFSTEEPEPPQVILNGKTSKSFMTSMRNSFKKLASFLSLSKNKEAVIKHPVPPPQHTKPDQGTVVGKYRQCVKPSSPSLAREYSSRSKSYVNLQNNKSVKTDSSSGDKYKKADDEIFNGADVDETPKPKTSYTSGTANKTPPPSLMSHINTHYSKPNPSRFSSDFGNLSRSRAPRQSTPSLCQSSPGTLLPSPPSQRKPMWRETKASKLRLNRVKVPSMTSLNF
ncbi:uncharacterized protein LOC134825250 isoform X2 [Bolinopsis microptera]|uniref:uncharacterized protein LOC134825250 isoform X2 n=2 Tax=Bolinopsis microptera TaxID=2820187 RepID=UPI0030791EA8